MCVMVEKVVCVVVKFVCQVLNDFIFLNVVCNVFGVSVIGR